MKKSLYATISLLGAAAMASAEPMTIGEVTFPLGDAAFATQAMCLDWEQDWNNCGGELEYRGGPPDYFYLPADTGYTGEHILDVVVTDTDVFDEAALVFVGPIRNQAGPDLYLAQAEYVSGLGNGGGLEDFDIRFETGPAWYTITPDQFAEDQVLDTQTIYYFKFDGLWVATYRLWYATIDLSDYGFASDDVLTGLTIRGPVAGYLDVVTVASLNEPVAADLDGDALVNLADFGLLSTCTNGPGESTPPAECQPDDFDRADLDLDDDVDLLDFAEFQRLYAGTVSAPTYTISGDFVNATGYPEIIVANLMIGVGPVTRYDKSWSDYALTFVPDGTYTITPHYTLDGRYFYPLSAEVTVNGGDVVVPDFEAHLIPKGSDADMEVEGVVTALDPEEYRFAMDVGGNSLLLFIYVETAGIGSPPSLDNLEVGWEIKVKYFSDLNLAKEIELLTQ